MLLFNVIITRWIDQLFVCLFAKDLRHREKVWLFNEVGGHVMVIDAERASCVSSDQRNKSNDVGNNSILLRLSRKYAKIMVPLVRLTGVGGVNDSPA